MMVCTCEQILFDIWSTEPVKRFRYEELPREIVKRKLKLEISYFNSITKRSYFFNSHGH